MAIMQLVCSNFLPKFQCSPSHKGLNDNAASADQSTIMTSTIIETNSPGLDKRKEEEGEEEHGVCVSVCAKTDFSGRNQKWWCEEDEKKLQLDKGSTERERERKKFWFLFWKSVLVQIQFFLTWTETYDLTTD